MSDRFRFTTGRLEKLTCPEGKDRVYFRDNKTYGLQVCVTDSGAKTFVIYRRVNGRPTRVRLGLWPHELSIDDARREADKVNGEIGQGIDPREKKRAGRRELTLGALFEKHLAIAKQHNRTWAENQKQYDRYLAVWKNRRLSEIARADVQALHARIGDDNGPYAANRALSLLAHAFRVTAPDMGWTKGNPAAGIQRFKERSRERFLQADELPRFFEALRESPELQRDFFAVALFTGARRGNVSAMKWADVSLSLATWRIPDSESKNGQALTVTLSATVVEILTRRYADRKGPYVFPGRGKSGHYQEPKNAWKGLLKRAGIEDLRIHDLRRTLGSWQAALGTSSAIIGKSLGHKSTQATAIYSRLAIEPVRAAVNAASAAILAAGAKGVGNGEA